MRKCGCVIALMISLLAISCREVDVPSVIHVTDLTRPYGDPDDHWDAACQFALAKMGCITLEGVVMDNLPQIGEPDHIAISQLNAITGLEVPAGVGQLNSFESEESGSGLELIRTRLEESEQPVTIHVCGGCLDIVEAAALWPELFREKVAAVYMYAGCAEESDIIEYNVALHPREYAAMFDLPCPIYWLPCMQNVAEWCACGGCVGQNCSYFRFRQDTILNSLPKEAANYFICALSRFIPEEQNDTAANEYLGRTPDQESLALYGSQMRNMWCTPGILHGAGLTVHTDGTIHHRSAETSNKELFRFIPIEVTCSCEGRTNWKPLENSDSITPGRFIFEVNDLDAYETAMTSALCTLILQLH